MARLTQHEYSVAGQPELWNGVRVNPSGRSGASPPRVRLLTTRARGELTLTLTPKPNPAAPLTTSYPNPNPNPNPSEHSRPAVPTRTFPDGSSSLLALPPPGGREGGGVEGRGLTSSFLLALPPGGREGRGWVGQTVVNPSGKVRVNLRRARSG